MKYKPLALGLAVALTFLVSTAHPHGVPINAYVQAATGQIAVFDGYEPGELESLGGSDIFTDTPGIGISSPVNGFTAGDTLLLNVVEGLLFWDGTNVVSTSETMFIDWPDNGGTSNVESYDVTAQSTYQTGMTWGTYQPSDGTGSWDAHGDFALESANPPIGIYGLVLQLASPNHIASEPFLLPLIYDPETSFGAIAIAAGIGELKGAMLELPTADFDRNTEVNNTDLTIWQTNYASPLAVSQVQGDATQDATVNGKDFLAWQRQYTGPPDAVDLTMNTQTVPEPTTLLLASLTFATIFTFNFSTRKHTMSKLLTVFAFTTLLLSAAQDSQAAITTLKFQAELNAAGVQPQKPAHADSTATAFADFVLTQDDTNPSATTLSYDIQFNGLDITPTDNLNLLDDVTAVHFHDTSVCVNPTLCGDGSGGQLPGSTAGTRHVLNVLGVPREDDADLQIFATAERVTGLWDDSDANTEMMAPSQSIADPTILDLLFNGKLAVMVHTNRIPSGEIGGYIQQVPEPTAFTLTILTISTLLSSHRPRRARFSGRGAPTNS